MNISQACIMIIKYWFYTHIFCENRYLLSWARPTVLSLGVIMHRLRTNICSSHKMFVLGENRRYNLQRSRQSYYTNWAGRSVPEHSESILIILVVRHARYCIRLCLIIPIRKCVESRKYHNIRYTYLTKPNVCLPHLCRYNSNQECLVIRLLL